MIDSKHRTFFIWGKKSSTLFPLWFSGKWFRTQATHLEVDPISYWTMIVGGAYCHQPIIKRGWGRMSSIASPARFAGCKKQTNVIRSLPSKTKHARQEIWQTQLTRQEKTLARQSFCSRRRHWACTSWFQLSWLSRSICPLLQVEQDPTYNVLQSPQFYCPCTTQVMLITISS